MFIPYTKYVYIICNNFSLIHPHIFFGARCTCGSDVWVRQRWCLLQGRLRWDCLGFLAHKTFDHPMSREPAYASMLGDTLLSVLNETSHNSKNKETFQIEGLIQLKRISNSLKRCQNYLCFSHSKLSFASQADGSPSPERRSRVLFVSQKHGALEWTKCALNQYFYM